MYHAPFHRRILPWIYGLVFLAAAPVLVFYTAGYRYNPKKSVLEYNASLIADSFPKGMRVYVDGQDTGELTPTTIQNITPGSHRIKYERAGYQTWEKLLLMTPEQVTFADQIWMWRTQPSVSLQTPGTFFDLSAADSASLLVAAETVSSSTVVRFFDTTLQPVRSVTVTTTVSRLDWNGNATEVLARGAEGQTSTLLTLRDTSIQSQRLPAGDFSWIDQSLVSAEGLYSPASKSVTSSSVQGLLIQTATGTPARLLVDQLLTKKTYSLPRGSWSLAAIRKPNLLLRDQNRWLGLSLTGDGQQAQSLYGDYPRWFTRDSVADGLWINGTELLLWTIPEAPRLLIRQSQPIVAATWHRSGKFVFFATNETLYALELDDRGGRFTTELARFDEIRDISTFGTEILVAGKKDGREGLWRVAAE